MSGITITSKDIVEILNAAKDSKVRTIKLGALSMEFDTNFHPNKSNYYAAHKDVISEGEEGQAIGPQTLPTVNEPSVPDDELMLTEMLDQIAIEDPAQFEELQLKLMNKGSAN